MSDLQHKELAIKCGALLGVIITSDNERRVKVTSFSFTEKQLNSFADKIENQAEESNQLEIEQLREALSELLRHYVSLVESGDAGCWDSENEDVVIAARQALAKKKG